MDEQLTEEIYLAAVERAKVDKRLAKGLELLERRNTEMLRLHGEYDDAKKALQEAEAAIVQHMKMGLV